MIYYIAIFAQSSLGEWKLFFPDFPKCEAPEFNVQDAISVAEAVLSQLAREAVTLPRARDMSEIKLDRDWLSQQDIDLSGPVVLRMIPLAA